MNEEPELSVNLKKGFAEVINKNCGENEANIPDYIIADYLLRCFNILNHATKTRDNWYGVKLEPGKSNER